MILLRKLCPRLYWRFRLRRRRPISQAQHCAKLAADRAAERWEDRARYRLN